MALTSEEGFDTSVPGASELRWAALMAMASTWMPAKQPLLIVAPHPDDETLGAGALICTWAAIHLGVTVLSVTDGEAACPEVAGLAALRRNELVGALGALEAANTDIVRLEFPDGAVARHEAELTRAICAHLPKGATLVAPFEFDGHPDHDAAGRAAIEAARRTNAPLARYPIWAWYRGSPELLAERRITRFEMGSRARRAKQRAVAQFSSQLADRPGGPILPAHVLAYFDRPYEVFLL